MEEFQGFFQENEKLVVDIHYEEIFTGFGLPIDSVIVQGTRFTFKLINSICE